MPMVQIGTFVDALDQEALGFAVVPAVKARSGYPAMPKSAGDS